MTVASPPPPPPPGAPIAPAKKGMGPLGWVLIGCGVIALMGFIALMVGGYVFKKKVVDRYAANPVMAAAEDIVRINPELELISSDPEKGTITVKNKETGETVTVDASKIKEDGKITFETKEGKTVVDASQSGESGSIKVTGADGQQVTWGGEAPKDLPAWVPIYPGSDVQAALDTTSSDGRTASFNVTTTDSVDQVTEFYESKLNEAGLKVSKNTMESNGERSAVVTANSEDDKQSVMAMIGQQDGKTQASVTFTVKK
jgi:hypothetical protein